MRVVFVHGWSVTSTDTYGGLPTALVKNAPTTLDLQVSHLHLGKYVSFNDEVTIDDIARAMEQALAEEVFPNLAAGERFACITHSTGGPVVRTWIDLYYRGKLESCPMSHLVMLAPANHGSALAQLGKSRLSRMKFFAEGVEPGTRVLDWLELGSDGSWDLNSAWLDYDCTAGGLYIFVLSGQKIDRALYDNLNTYTDEAGSDGVVRLAAANMNYGLLRLVQRKGKLQLRKETRSARTAFGVLPGRSHSGSDIGILGSIHPDDDGSHPSVRWVLRCLGVSSDNAYARVTKELVGLTAKTQKDEHVDEQKVLFVHNRKFFTNRYCMLVFRIVDDRGNSLNDYDVIFTAGPRYDANHLPPGFFVDRQRNQRNPGKLTYYIDHTVMEEGLSVPQLEGRFGITLRARPDSGFARYAPLVFEGRLSDLRRYFEPNQTLMVEVVLERLVDRGVFRLTANLTPEDVGRETIGKDVG